MCLGKGCTPKSNLVYHSFHIKGVFEGIPHSHTLDRPHVVVGFRTCLSNGKISGKALCCRDRRGWFLAWPPCHDKRKWPSSSKNWKNGDCTLQNKYVDSASRIHFQWLVGASSLDCHCYKSDSPPAWKSERENRTKTQKTNSPFRNGVWCTHQGRMSPRSCFDFTGVQWHGILRAEENPAVHTTVQADGN